MVYEVSGVDARDSHILDIGKGDDYLILRQVSTALDPTQFAHGIISSVNVLSVGLLWLAEGMLPPPLNASTHQNKCYR